MDRPILACGLRFLRVNKSKTTATQLLLSGFLFISFLALPTQSRAASGQASCRAGSWQLFGTVSCKQDCPDDQVCIFNNIGIRRRHAIEYWTSFILFESCGCKKRNQSTTTLLLNPEEQTAVEEFMREALNLPDLVIEQGTTLCRPNE